MKKAVLALSLCSVTLFTGCSASKQQGSEVTDNISNPVKVSSPTKFYDEDYNNSTYQGSDFGFTRMNSATINGKNIANVANENIAIDREQLASVITSLAASLPNVKRVATLVTDEDVLVVYETHSSDRSETADQVKRTAMSVVPRYYHAYVSDDWKLAQDIENFATLGSNDKHIDHTIDKTIQNMLKSPQGKEYSKGENANGEMIHQKDERMNTNR
ncbi:YhcN/YlaJ family sporulation lipoprotein [Peribacillus loiseleuriae]|uniref:YhcN/YlaJ family sporulation lipoprotein n=1 Tax=Peribacillus loiseleuriae TaxID=1679170 RepID=UPI00382F89B1